MHCNLAVALLLQYTGYLTLDVVELEVTVTLHGQE